LTNDESWALWEVPADLRRKMLAVARSFRKEPTPSESILWKALRRKALDGIKFRRQQQADHVQQELLEELGLRFVRLSAELVENDLDGALEKIRRAVTPLSPDPFLPPGEKEE